MDECEAVLWAASRVGYLADNWAKHSDVRKVVLMDDKRDELKAEYLAVESVPCWVALKDNCLAVH